MGRKRCNKITAGAFLRWKRVPKKAKLFWGEEQASDRASF
jgi:hypothetical protein